jgi:hypothetical protein
MIYNGNAQKRSQLIQPEKLFKLPQDKIKRPQAKPPTAEQTRIFAQKVENIKNKKILKI